MPDITISDLPSKTELLDSDSIVIDDGAESYKVTGAQFRTFLLGDIAAALDEILGA